MTRAARLAALAPLAAALWLAGCAAPAPAPTVAEPPPVRTPAEPADPDRRARVRLELASAYFGRGQLQPAREELRQVLALRPDLPEAHSLLALIQAASGDARAAEASFRRTLQLAPADADAMHNFGWFLCQQRRYDEAEAQFMAALAVPGYPEQARTLLLSGVCHGRNNRMAEAERAFMRSFELDPSNTSTTFNLADVLYRRGDYERARFYLKRLNGSQENSNALSLWLAVRTEYKLGNTAGVQEIGRQLRERFPQAPETERLERGRFDE